MSLLHSFSESNNIPFGTGHVLLIHLPVGEHLGCSCFLAILSSKVAVNICVQGFVWIDPNLGDIHLGVTVPGHVVTLRLCP